jgi:hypothetical protein
VRHAVAQFVEALCYEAEGREVDSRLGRCIFAGYTKTLLLTYQTTEHDMLGDSPGGTKWKQIALYLLDILWRGLVGW